LRDGGENSKHKHPHILTEEYGFLRLEFLFFWVSGQSPFLLGGFTQSSSNKSGFYYEPRFLGGTGCGFETINGLVRDLWRPAMGEEMAILIAMKAMLQSGAANSGVSDSRLHLPTVGVIDKNGFRLIPDKLLNVVRKELIEQTGSLR